MITIVDRFGSVWHVNPHHVVAVCDQIDGVTRRWSVYVYLYGRDRPIEADEPADDLVRRIYEAKHPV